MCYLARGTKVGQGKRYEVEAWLGFSAGALGTELFAARDRETDEVVLLKAFPDEDGGSFERDARRAAELDHPSLARVADYGAVRTPWGETLHWVVERCAPARSLRLVLAARPPAVEVEPLVRTLCEGVEYLRAHDHAVDVAPGEVYVAEPTRVRWGVFGLPKLAPDAEPAALVGARHAYPSLFAAA